MWGIREIQKQSILRGRIFLLCELTYFIRAPSPICGIEHFRMKRQSAVFFLWLCGLGGVIRLGGESAVFNCRIPRNLVTNSNTLAIFDERGWPMAFSPFFPLFLHVLCRCATLWVVTDLNLRNKKEA